MAHPLVHYLWWVLGLEAKPSEETLLRSMSLSCPWTSRDGSRGGLLTPLGGWPLLTTVAVCEDGGNRLLAPPGNSVTQKLAWTGPKLSSSPAPVMATAKTSVCCCETVVGVLGAKQKSKDTTKRKWEHFPCIDYTNNYDKRVETSIRLETIKCEPFKSINKRMICPVI